jgi:hypothetical protein
VSTPGGKPSGGACIDRCVNDALFFDRFDRRACWEMCLSNGARYSEGATEVCGKCLVGVPCSFVNPVRRILHGGTGR